MSDWSGEYVSCQKLALERRRGQGKRRALEYFNGLENFRTETEHNDALIIKTVVFQSINSYITLFFTAFIRSFEVPIGALFGDGGNDPTTGAPFRDMSPCIISACLAMEAISRAL